MTIHKQKYSKKEVSQRYNLKKLLGYEPNERQKELFYNLAVDKMVQRTASGKDVDNNNFTAYSKEYAAKKGVSRNAVDLILEGDMLNSFEENKKQKNIVKIKMQDGVETLKAYNHNIGDTLPKREFFGFKDEKDIEDIILQVDQAREQKQAPTESTISAVDLVALRQSVREIEVEFSGFGSTFNEDENA